MVGWMEGIGYRIDTTSPRVSDSPLIAQSTSRSMLSSAPGCAVERMINCYTDSLWFGQIDR
jgi:hypothetical protein